MQKSLIAEIQGRLGYAQNLNNYSKKSQFLQLILINYKPIVRYREGLKEYLYVDVYDNKGSVYFLQRRSTPTERENKKGVRSEGLFDDIVKIYVNSDEFVYDLTRLMHCGVVNKLGEVLTDVEGKEAVIIDEGGDIEINYSRRNLELQAILIFTRDFQLFERAVIAQSNVNRFGRYVLNEVMNWKGEELTPSVWMHIAYNSYMLYRNIELTDYYYTHLVRPNSDMFFEINRVCVFDEFIPLGFKFSDIHNPILNDEVIFESYSKIFKNGLKAGPLPMVGGSKVSFSSVQDDSETYGLYTTRYELTSLFGVSVGRYKVNEVQDLLPIKTKKQTIDYYSPSYFLTILYTQLVESSDKGDWFSLVGLQEDVIIRYKEDYWITEDGAKQEMDTIAFNGIDLSIGKQRVNSPLYSYKSISFISALMIQYLTNVYRAVHASNGWNHQVYTADLTKDVID